MPLFAGNVETSDSLNALGLTTRHAAEGPVFEVRAAYGAARAGVLRTAHGEVRTPVFMPVGTKATVKTLHPDEVRSLGAQILLGNTYHLHFRPGSDVVLDLGGLHRFMNWDAHRSQEETAAFIAHMKTARDAGTDYVFVVLHEADLVAMIGLHDVARTMRAWRVDRAEMGYWTAPAHQNRGFITEAARALMRFGFEELGLHKITIGCIADNQPSRRVIEIGLAG